jgi:hypothetical protein
LDDKTTKLTPTKIDTICKDLGGRFEQVITKTTMNYSVVWWFPGKDCEVILELIVGEGIEVASKTVT